MHIKGWKSQSLDIEREFRKYPTPCLCFLSSYANPFISLETESPCLLSSYLSREPKRPCAGLQGPWLCTAHDSWLSCGAMTCDS